LMFDRQSRFNFTLLQWNLINELLINLLYLHFGGHCLSVTHIFNILSGSILYLISDSAPSIRETGCGVLDRGSV
jgi:hypothetical protein